MSLPPPPPGFRHAFDHSSETAETLARAAHPTGPKAGAHILEPRLVDHKAIMVVASQVVTGWQVARTREDDGTQARSRTIHLRFAGRIPQSGDDAGLEAICPIEEARALHKALGEALAHCDADPTAN